MSAAPFTYNAPSARKTIEVATIDLAGSPEMLLLQLLTCLLVFAGYEITGWDCSP